MAKHEPFSLKFSRDPIFGGSHGTSTVEFCKTLTVCSHWARWYSTNVYCGAHSRKTKITFNVFRWIFKPDFRIPQEKLSRIKKKIIKNGPELAILSTFFSLRTRVSNKLQPLISGLNLDGFRRIFFSNGLKFPEEFENQVEKFIRATFWTGEIVSIIFLMSCFKVLNVLTRFPLSFFCTDSPKFKISGDTEPFSLKISRDPFFGGSHGTSTVEFCKTLTVCSHWPGWYSPNVYRGAQSRSTRDNF